MRSAKHDALKALAPFSKSEDGIKIFTLCFNELCQRARLFGKRGFIPETGDASPEAAEQRMKAYRNELEEVFFADLSDLPADLLEEGFKRAIRKWKSSDYGIPQPGDIRDAVEVLLDERRTVRRTLHTADRQVQRQGDAALAAKVFPTMTRRKRTPEELEEMEAAIRLLKQG